MDERKQQTSNTDEQTDNEEITEYTCNQKGCTSENHTFTTAKGFKRNLRYVLCIFKHLVLAAFSP